MSCVLPEVGVGMGERGWTDGSHVEIRLSRSPEIQDAEYSPPFPFAYRPDVDGARRKRVLRTTRPERLSEAGFCMDSKVCL